MVRASNIFTCAGLLRIQLATVLCLVLMVCYIPGAMAAQSGAPDPKCTNSPEYYVSPTPLKGGVLTSIQTSMQGQLQNAYTGIYGSVMGGVAPIARTMCTLYVIMYGAMFTIGLVNATAYEFAARVVKVAVVGMLITDTAGANFNKYVVGVFRDGTNEIIQKIVTSAAGYDDVIETNNTTPFIAIDAVVEKVISPKMWVTALTSFSTFPYGSVIGFLMALAIWKFLQSLLMAMWVYLMAMVLQTLLFGVAPLFIPCILFDRTMPLFKGWLSQVANTSMQPIFLFVFFAFFTGLMGHAMENIMKTPACDTAAPQSLRGMPFRIFYMRFTIPNSKGGHEMFEGPWGPGGPSADGGGNVSGNAPFPIDIKDVIIFLILAELCTQFNHVVVMIARDLAGSSVELTAQSGSLPEAVQKVRNIGKASSSDSTQVKGLAPAPRQTPGAPGVTGASAGRAGGARPGSGGSMGRPGASGADSVQDRIRNAANRATGNARVSGGGNFAPPTAGPRTSASMAKNIGNLSTRGSRSEPDENP